MIAEGMSDADFGAHPEPSAAGTNENRRLTAESGRIHTTGNIMQDPVRIGLDFGGVIVRMIPSASPATAAQPDDQWVSRAPIAGAFDAMRHLVERFDGRVWIVSKAGPRMQARTLAWISDTGFHEYTGLVASQVLFCRTREDKVPICTALGITHFVDDREHVLQLLRPMWRICFSSAPTTGAAAGERAG